METMKVGKLIQQLRKEKKLTQHELGDKLGVSPKTISKWETGGGLPDIGFLKRISEIFNITIEELLDGTLNKKEKTNTKKNKKTVFIIAILIIIIMLIITLAFKNKNKLVEGLNNCTVTRTYYIDNIGKSNDDKYLYITVHEYQVEGTYTIKLPKLISNNLEIGNNYEFTFKTSENNVNAATDILFENSEVLNLNYTDKVGNEQINTYHCDSKQ